MKPVNSTLTSLIGKHFVARLISDSSSNPNYCALVQFTIENGSAPTQLKTTILYLPYSTIEKYNYWVYFISNTECSRKSLTEVKTRNNSR